MAKRKKVKTADVDGFTERVLLSLVVDIGDLLYAVERTKVQVFALARERGIEPYPGGLI